MGSAAGTVLNFPDHASPAPRQLPNGWNGAVAQHFAAQLPLFNYTHPAQVAARWCFFECVSRGLILNAESGEIAARPFDKFFNWNERGRTTDAPLICVTEKMDGILGILYRNAGYRIAPYLFARYDHHDVRELILRRGFVKLDADGH